MESPLSSSSGSSSDSPTPHTQPSLTTTTQNIAFTIAQNGSFSWDNRSHTCIAHAQPALRNAANVFTEGDLRHAERLYSTAVSAAIKPYVDRGLLDSESAKTIRKAFLTLTVKAAIGQSIGRVFEYFVSPEILQTLSGPSTLLTPGVSQTLATAFMASVGLFDSHNAEEASEWLSAIIRPLVVQCLYLHMAGRLLVSPNRQWPVASYAHLPVDLTEHVARVSHLQGILSGELTATTTIENDVSSSPGSPSPSSASALRPSQALCKLERRKIVHTGPLDYYTFRRNKRIYDAAKASVRRETNKRRANRENVAPVLVTTA